MLFVFILSCLKGVGLDKKFTDNNLVSKYQNPKESEKRIFLFNGSKIHRALLKNFDYFQISLFGEKRLAIRLDFRYQRIIVWGKALDIDLFVRQVKLNCVQSKDLCAVEWRARQRNLLPISSAWRFRLRDWCRSGVKVEIV